MATTKIGVNNNKGLWLHLSHGSIRRSDGTDIAGHASTMAVATARSVAKTTTMAVTRHLLRGERGGM